MRKTVSLLALTGLFALSACDWGKKRDEEQPFNNAANEVVDNAVENVPEAPPPVNEVANTSNVVMPPPPPQVSEDQQTLDDADATGLTSRLPEEDAGGNVAH